MIFDEIQEVTNWEKCINSFRVSLDCDIYITGSNAKLLSGEYLLTGGMPYLANISTNEQYYVADHGIREAVFGGNMRDINLILENIVYMELLRREYKVTVGKIGNKEIDFICDIRGEKLYIQVAYLLADDSTIQREFGVYESIKDNFPKYVITMDELDMSRNGIKHRNIRDFLTASEWN